MKRVNNLQEAYKFYPFTSPHDEIMSINEEAINEYLCGLDGGQNGAKEEFENRFEKQADKIIHLVHDIQLLGLKQTQSQGVFYAALRILFNEHSAEVLNRLGVDETYDFNNYIDSTFSRIETNEERERAVNLNV